MSWRVESANREDFIWLQQRTSCGMTDGFRAIKCVDESGRIRGMVGYDGWTENACQCHMAVDSPTAWRALVRPAFEYPFQQAGRRVIIGLIPAGNARSVHLAKRLGLRETYRVRDGWALGEDLVVLEMRREECRWLQQRKAA